MLKMLMKYQFFLENLFRGVQVDGYHLQTILHFVASVKKVSTTKFIAMDLQLLGMNPVNISPFVV
jgi:hypothetical protein